MFINRNILLFEVFNSSFDRYYFQLNHNPYFNQYLINKSFNLDSIDYVLLNHIKKSGLYGATPYIYSFNNTLQDIFIDLSLYPFEFLTNYYYYSS